MAAIIVRCPACSTQNRIADTRQHQQPRCGKCKEKIAMDNQDVTVVLGVPALLVFKDGKQVDEIVGRSNRHILLAK